MFHLSLPKPLLLFILASVYKSLQCLISALTQGGRSGHLFRLTSSAVLWGGRKTAKNITGVCGECSQCMDHAGFVPTHNVCASQSTLLRLQVALQGNCPKWALSCMHFPGLICSGSGSWVLHKGTDFVGPAFCALPGPRSSGDQLLGDRTLPGGLCILITSQVPALGFLGVPVRALSQVCHVSPLRS